MNRCIMLYFVCVLLCLASFMGALRACPPNLGLVLEQSVLPALTE